MPIPSVLSSILSSPKRIKQNVVLHSAKHGMELDHLLVLKQAGDLAKKMTGAELNLAYLTEGQIRDVHAAFGPDGLLQVMMLTMGTEKYEFDLFMGTMPGESVLDALSQGSPAAELVCDNAFLPQSVKLNGFNANVLQPSLSRKLYRAGRHHGSLVYGVGGPRILVSHPFREIDDDIYDLYQNSVDVVTSLQVRGYFGQMHLLDYLPGLNHLVDGVPAWAVWFSVIAAHSDLVIFVKMSDREFGPSQRVEIEMTPDRVQKKIVEMPPDELKWAKKAAIPEGAGKMYIGEKGVMSEEEWHHMEAEHAAPFIENYTSSGFPHDRLIVIDESGAVLEYPLDYPLYSNA